ncbi:MAG: PTS galactitol transporter subunit IIC [Tissierellales bacterium]|nr:PTS galactitol transporter subunit IIC [Tissierellales bacterium]
MTFINFILDMGASVMLPIIITILGLVFKQKFSKAFRSGLTVGIGFVAIFMIVGMLVSNLSPATQAMVENLGLQLDVMDVGWPISASISFGTTIVPAVFAACFVINIIMLSLNLTKTMNVDIWNYWHFIFTGALVMYLTNSMALGVVAAVICFIIIMKLADYTAPYVSDFFGMPGVSLPHTETVSWAPLGILIDKILDKIPGINKIEIYPEGIQKRFGILGEPMIMGLVLGASIGALAGYDAQGIIGLGVNMAAVMFLMPRMVRILMEGLLPLSESAREYIGSKFPGKEVYIGLDAAVAIGHPSVISTGLLLIPVTLLLAVILPGNRVLPFTDLGLIPILMVWAVAPSRGNVFRGLITGTIFMALILLIATDLAEITTLMAVDVQFPIPEGASLISSLDEGAHLIPYLIYKAFSFFF